MIALLVELIMVERYDLLRTYAHAESATLAKVFVKCYLIHFLPPLKILFIADRRDNIELSE